MVAAVLVGDRASMYTKVGKQCLIIRVISAACVVVHIRARLFVFKMLLRKSVFFIHVSIRHVGCLGHLVVLHHRRRVFHGHGVWIGIRCIGNRQVRRHTLDNVVDLIIVHALSQLFHQRM